MIFSLGLGKFDYGEFEILGHDNTGSILGLCGTGSKNLKKYQNFKFIIS